MISGYIGYFNPRLLVTIAAGDTESTVIQCAGFVLMNIILPALFSGTALSFLVGDSTDGFQATGIATFTGTTTDGDTIEINGVTITFVDADPGDFEVLIGGTSADTAQNLFDFLDATDDEDLLACTYSLVGLVLTVLAVVHGTDGNAYTFAKSSTNITLTPSGGTLTGGGFRPLYNPSNALVSMTVAQNRCYAVDPTFLQGVPFLKIKSGTTETSARTLVCTLKGQ